MVIKPNTWKVPYSGKLLQYIRKGALENENGGFTLFYNASYPSIEGISKDFDEIAERIDNQNQIKVYFHHNILAFHADDDDKLTDEVLEDLTLKYLEESGLDKTVCYARVHEKNGARHVHIMAGNVPVGPVNKSLRISHQEFERVRLAVEKYQVEKHGLTKSVVYLDKPLKPKRDIVSENRNRRRENEFALRQKGPKALAKDKVTELLEHFLKKSGSYDDFIGHILKHPEIDLHQYRQKTNGVEYGGYTFRFTTLGLKPALIALDKHEHSEIEERRKRLEKLRSRREKIKRKF